MLTHAMNRFICSQRDLWLDLGRAESKWLRKKLDATPIDRPVYITGLARGGTTITLELLARMEGVVTHTYRDFPLLLTPYALRRFFAFFDCFDLGTSKKIERSHKDRLLITASSPESMEEVLWMSFFKTLHDETRSNTLGATTSLPAFERFYTDHIKKLLLAEKASRYVSKANYNLTRIRYLHKLFPDARFVLVVRDPVWHIASLMKQHRIFCEEQQKNPAALEHTNMSGHFEFGLGRKLIHTGDDAKMSAILETFAAGRDTQGWARYWGALYAYGLGLLDDPALRDRLLVVHYEELCEKAEVTLDRLLTFTELPCDEATKRTMAGELSVPDYYQPKFTEEELASIRSLTDATYRAYDRFRL